MSTKKKFTNEKQSYEKKVLLEISPLLSTSLISLKERLGEKKFEKRIRKAARLLIHGIKPLPAKKADVKSKVLKKAAKWPVNQKISGKTIKPSPKK